jgi:hypothetical protein
LLNRQEDLEDQEFIEYEEDIYGNRYPVRGRSRLNSLRNQEDIEDEYKQQHHYRMGNRVGGGRYLSGCKGSHCNTNTSTEDNLGSTPLFITNGC